MENKKALVVFSGGMDSTVGVYWAVKNYSQVETLSFYYGSKHNEQEHKHALKTCEKLGLKNTRIDLDFMNKYFKSDLLQSGGDIPEGYYTEENMKSTVVPFRNGIMLSIAAGFAESQDCDLLILGNHRGDHAIYPDCRESFIDGIKKAIYEGTAKNIEVISPFCNISKTDICKLGQELGVDYSLTYSCYKGGEKHCGKCGTCTERIEAFRDSGVPDPTVYEELASV